MLLVSALGLTLGAVICALAFTYLVIWQPLPYPLQERLVVAEQVVIDHAESTHSRAFSYPAIGLLHREAQAVFAASVMIDHLRDVVVSHPAQPLTNVSYVDGDYAELFAPPMAAGRFHGAKAGEGGAVPVAVISHAAWQMLFDMREDVVGATLRTVAGVDFEVIGVTSRDFIEPEFHGVGHRTAVWLPWDFNPSLPHWAWTAATPTLTFVARVSPTVNEQQAVERLSLRLNTRWRDETGAVSSGHAGLSTHIELTGARRAIAGDSVDVGPLLLIGALGLALLALVNVAQMLLAGIAERAREFSIQMALGARRTHLFVQLLVDMLLLMLPAGALALMVAAAGFALMRHYLGSMLARLDELSVGAMMVAVTIATVVALAMLLAAVALASIGHPGANGALNAGRQATATRMSRRARSMLMASQVGVAALLITVGIGLFRDADRVLSERGIDLAHASSVFLYPSTAALQGEASLAPQYRDVRRRLTELPGVLKVSQSHSPLQDFIPATMVSARTGATYSAALKRIDHAYLAITGHGLATGRNFSADEIQQGAEVAMVNATFARLLARDGEVLGLPLSRGSGSPYAIVGVVDDLAYPGVPVDSPRIYLPASEAGSNFVIKFHPGQRMHREALVAFIAEVNPGLAVFLYDDLDRQRADILLPRRIMATATLAIALIVILVSALGLHGMVSYTTRLVRSEIGARLAFGAQPRHIVLMLVRGNLAAVLAGCVASVAVVVLVLPGAYHWLGVPALDVHWLDAAMALSALILLALLACYLAARPLLSQSPAAVLSQPAG